MITNSAVYSPTRRLLKPAVLAKEGERVRIPEGGELVCCRSPVDSTQIYLKIEYSRETLLELATSPIATQRPHNFVELIEDSPEIVRGGPADCLASSDETNSQTPMRGPITPVNRRVADIHYEHIWNPKLFSSDVLLSPAGCPLMTPKRRSSMTPIKNPRFS